DVFLVTQKPALRAVWPRGKPLWTTPEGARIRAAGMYGATEKSIGGETRGPAQSPADHGGARRDRAQRRHSWHQPFRICPPPFPELPPSRSFGRAAPRCR